MSQVFYPQPRQSLVVKCPFYEILYGGSAGAGKSFLLILDWLAHWERYGAKSSGILFRNTYGELEEIRETMEEVFGDTGARWSKNDSAYRFPDKAKLKLSYLDSFDDALKHKGFEYTWRAHDELTQRPTDKEYMYLFSRMRSPDGVPIRNLSASNPDGPGHLWVKKRFKIDEYPQGLVPLHTYFEVDASGQPKRILSEEEGVAYDKMKELELPAKIRRRTRVFIPGKLSDNRYLHEDGMYRETLMGLPEAQRRMLLDGRWDVVEGAFFDEWDPKYHVVKAFTPPKDWKRWQSGDWGTNKPYAFLWFCESPHGEVFIYRELVGRKVGTLDEGVRESAQTVAGKIRAIEQEAGEYIRERWLDASCFDNEEHGLSISEQFAAKGVSFQKSQKKFKGGSISMFRDYLKIVNGMCRFKLMDNCVYLQQTLPLLLVDPIHVEQYDTKGPDHGVDSLIYGIRRNIKTREEIAKERGQSVRNEQILKRIGRFGAH